MNVTVTMAGDQSTHEVDAWRLDALTVLFVSMLPSAPKATAVDVNPERAYFEALVSGEIVRIEAHPQTE